MLYNKFSQQLQLRPYSGYTAEQHSVYKTSGNVETFSWFNIRISYVDRQNVPGFYGHRANTDISDNHPNSSYCEGLYGRFLKEYLYHLPNKDAISTRIDGRHFSHANSDHNHSSKVHYYNWILNYINNGPSYHDAARSEMAGAHENIKNDIVKVVGLQKEILSYILSQESYFIVDCQRASSTLSSLNSQLSTLDTSINAKQTELKQKQQLNTELTTTLQLTKQNFIPKLNNFVERATTEQKNLLVQKMIAMGLVSNNNSQEDIIYEGVTIISHSEPLQAIGEVDLENIQNA